MDSSTSAESVETVTSRRRRFRAWLVIYLKGCAIGAADAVPGISGGTIALITGVYERLIRALTGIDGSLFRTLLAIHRPAARAQFRRLLHERDIPFLVTLGLGMVTAVILIARVAQFALAQFPAVTFAFFAGLIGASAVILFESSWLRTPQYVIAALVGFFVAFFIAGASSAGVFPNSTYMAFVAGALAICGMLLPGISGAFILLLLGQFEFMTAVLTSFVDNLLGLIAGGGTDQLVADGIVVGVFLVGAFIGLFTIAHAVRWALDTARITTFAFLVSLMVGALRYPAERIGETAELSTLSLVGIAVATFAGIGAVVLLDAYTDDLDYTDPPGPT